ncbi:MAG: glycosyltransferase family 4 protein [Candidatus Dadabacteria bacterium]|nr:MAG: glycosyltransferase family 4 protein [Candidatus Dadabacteria bacterium]
MKICVLTTSFPRFEDDEASIFVKRLVCAFSDVGLGGFVIVPFDRNEKPREALGNFEIIRYRYGILRRGSLAFGAGIIPNLRSNPWLIMQAPALLAGLFYQAIKLRRKYQLIHANWLIGALPAFFVSVLTGKPYVITMRGEDLRLIKIRALRLLLAPIVKRASRIVSVNKSFLKDLNELYQLDQEKLMFIPNGVSITLPTIRELESYAKVHGYDTSKKYLLSIGTLVPRKRAHLLIKLLAEPAMAEFSLILCGRTNDSSYLDELNKLMHKLGVAERVILTGEVKPSEVPCLMALSRYYLSASEFEGRSNATLEAMAAGKVVILSDIESHREFIKHGENGYLFDSEDLNSVAKIISILEDNSGKRNLIEENARRFANNFSWEKCAAGYKLLFDNLLD